MVRTPGYPYDVFPFASNDPAGPKFLLNKIAGEQGTLASAPLHVITNWTAMVPEQK